MCERTAVGLIETRGLVAAIEAADAAVKAARVRLRGYELVSDGIVTIKLAGQVADVRAAVDTGAAAAGRVGALLSAHVIPALGEGMEEVVFGGRRPLSRGSSGAGLRESPDADEGSGQGRSEEGQLSEVTVPGREALEGMTLQELQSLARAQGLLSRREINRSSKVRLIECMLGGGEAKGEGGI